ncbi:MAG: alpha-L-rhamnosidase-related protein, partial [Chitinophagaceae bacterium]
MKSYLLVLILTISLKNASGQNTTSINPVLLKGDWSAEWITCPDVAQRDYGVFHFRKGFLLSQKPGKFIIHVSADNRYRLFVNGQPVCSGPARGDLYNWYFETVDIAKFLHPGNNIIAALVWNMGIYAPVAQISNQTAFLVQGEGDQEKIINTNSDWKVIRDTAYTPCSVNTGKRLHTYVVVGPGDQVNASKYPWGWEQLHFDDSQWPNAQKVATPTITGYGTDNLWTLTPRNIPLMEETLQRIPIVRRESGIQVPDDFLKGNHPFTVPAHTTVSILLDQTFLTVAYPELLVSMGKGATIKLTYAEALFDKQNQKGNRNEIKGKKIIGNYDVFELDGGARRLFRPLWFRTWRYMQLNITTQNQPLVVDDLYGMHTGYPFKAKATFSSNDPSLHNIWKVGWRTAGLCAGETYFDCPYYEQLQYEGDTRIQSLISLYVTGDDRLMRKALLDFYHSRIPDGLTQGRYPSNRLQVIPPFSLYWISMIYDYWMLRKDDRFLKQFLNPVRGILDWYEKN